MIKCIDLRAWEDKNKGEIKGKGEGVIKWDRALNHGEVRNQIKDSVGLKWKTGMITLNIFVCPVVHFMLRLVPAVGVIFFSFLM